MQVLVHIPGSLRQYCGGARQVRVECEAPSTLACVFERLHADHPGVVERALDEQGKIRQHVNVFVDGESIRAGPKRGLETPLGAGSEVWILPAVSGGQAAA
ncbi:MAG: MoaD/ThiS family protein [Chloroflexi bacterium]|nr:MAG: MoaD/ThiS family protein [Chloroflexota bacterium]